MSKYIPLKKGFSSVLLWSVISAAFIGPGTVTTTSRAGALFGGQLMWALVFSILATILLQEMAARLTIASGKNLGELIALEYSGKKGRVIPRLLFGALVFGCAAYEAGNLLGAVSGLSIFSFLPRKGITILLGGICAALLWSGNLRIIARVMGFLVASMGVAFIFAALHTPLPAGERALQLLVPVLPAGSALLVIAVVGTTIVPYNLFLGSGMGQGQAVAEMRWGIVIAVLIGGAISAAIMLVGSQISGVFSFEALAEALSTRMGASGRWLFGIGLFAAGFSSATTAPLAAAVAARSLLERKGEQKWSPHSWNYRLVWMLVLGTGLIFGLTEVKPIPVIIMAQALNGLLLPFMAVFLLLAANNKPLLGDYANGPVANILTLAIVGVTIFLGLHNMVLAANTAMPFFGQDALWPMVVNGGLTCFCVGMIGWRLSRQKK